MSGSARIVVATIALMGALATASAVGAQQAKGPPAAGADAAKAPAKPAEEKPKARRKCRRDTTSAVGMIGSVSCETEQERQARGQGSVAKLEREDAREYLRQQQMMGDYRPK